MRLRTAAATFVATLAAALVAAGTFAPTPAAAKGEGWKVDLNHSFVWFKIRHMDVCSAYGRFDDFSGTVMLDGEKPAASSVELSIKTESVDTGNAGRDKHLKNPDFFNAAQFPTITFKSTAVKMTDDTHFAVTGDLTMHGVTKAISVLLAKSGPVDGREGPVIGIEGTFSVKRSEWGMMKPIGAGSDEVQVTIAIEAAKQ